MVNLIFAQLLCSEQQTIQIATLEYPPFIYSENDQVKGPISEKVRDVFQELGINVIIKIYPIARGLFMVTKGDADAYFSLKKTPEREKQLLFTNEPLIQQPFVFFTTKESGIVWTGSIEDIKKYKIGVVSKTSYGAVFDNYVRNGIITNLDEAQTFEQNIRKLIAGRVDLVINSYDVGLTLLDKLQVENIIALSPPVEVVYSYLAFTKAKNYSELVEKYDILLKEKNKLKKQILSN